MKKFYAFTLAALVSTLGYAQSFTASSETTGFFNSGGCMGVVDMDQDGMDDIVVLHDSRELNIYYQNDNGTFFIEEYGQVSGSNQWGMAIGDFNNDGHNDVFCGGYYDNIHVVSINAIGDADFIDLEDSGLYMQGCSLSDMNDDGWLDAYACHDDAMSLVFENDGSGDLTLSSDLIDLYNYDYSAYPNTDHSGNYGSVFSDFDRDGDTDLFVAKCRQFVNNDPYDPRRVNQLWVKNGIGDWTEEALARGLVPYEQSWTSDFADIDNDGDFDCLLTNHSNTLFLYENNGGYFTNITAGSGLEINGFFLQAKFADLDNDGFQDLLISGGIERCFFNNGDNTFTDNSEAMSYGDTMHSFGIGDLNSDGFLDVYASYGDGYVDADFMNDDILWINDGNDNNFIGFSLEGTMSNKNAIGAVVEIQGDFGIQVREVRAGESYGINNTFKAHFGIGESESVDQVIIYWPSGAGTVIDNPTVGEYTHVVEGDCTIADANIVAPDGTSFCEGATLALEGPMGINYQYTWNTGDTSMGITVDAAGTYGLVITDGEGCTAATTVSINQAELSLPTISIDGDVGFCEGGSVTLIASAAESYDWSTGEDTQSIVVEASGTYNVAVPDENCPVDVSSEDVMVEVFANPDNPVVDDVTLDVAGEAILTGAEDTYYWYENEMDEDPVFVGMEYTTPVINSSTSYWVENVFEYNAFTYNGGMLDKTDEGTYQPNNTYYNTFDAWEDMIIDGVTTFSDIEAMREIGLYNGNGELVESVEVPVVLGENYLELDFFVPAGIGYSLRPMDDTPMLWRDESDDNLDYPFALGTLGEVTGTNRNGNNWNNYYYYFYDWKVSTPSVKCVSDRVEVMITVVSVSEIEALSSLSIFPNPAVENVTINYELLSSGLVGIDIVDQLGKRVFSERVTGVAGAVNTTVVDISALSAGMYFVEFMMNGQQVTQKLIVE